MWVPVTRVSDFSPRCKTLMSPSDKDLPVGALGCFWVGGCHTPVFTVPVHAASPGWPWAHGHEADLTHHGWSWSSCYHPSADLWCFHFISNHCTQCSVWTRQLWVFSSPVREDQCLFLQLFHLTWFEIIGYLLSLVTWRTFWGLARKQ